LINIEVLKSQLTEIGVIEKCTFCHDGQSVIEKTKSLLDVYIENCKAGKPALPVAFMLLDFQMPKKNGIQVIDEIRLYFKNCQKLNLDIKIDEPTYVILTAFMTPSFIKHGNSIGVTHIYAKPLQKE
jgi:CheY-like chemotaxis protein